VAPRFFGDFLIDRGFVTRERVIAAARRMREVNQTVAALAQARGWLTAPEIELIHVQQLLHNRVWGEQAVALGLLDPAQVTRLLADQRARHLRLGEALLELGYIERGALERALAEFADERARESAEPRRLPAALEQCAPVRYVLDHFTELVVRIARVTARLGEASEWKGKIEPEHAAQISLGGDVQLAIGIAADRGFGAALAEGWLGIPNDRLDRALLVDLLGELLNVMVGGAKSHLENLGVRVELGLPELDALPAHGTAIELAAPYGKGLLILSLD
jgi:stage V sporulation protein SpoVS